jgi:hypothetical protein
MEICYRFDWHHRGDVQLTDDGRPLLPTLPKEGGVYRMTFVRPTGGSAVYVGESLDLSRRAYHYRNPGPRQKTSLRINGLLRDELGKGMRVEVETVTRPSLTIDDKEVTVDFSKKPMRLLFENAALVELAARGTEQVFNL